MPVIENEFKDVQSQKSEHGETLSHLSDDENFIKKTIFINPRQAYAFASLWSIAIENDIIFLKNWLKTIADSLISVDGQGRKDIVEVSKYKSGSGVGWAEKFVDRMTNR